MRLAVSSISLLVLLLGCGKTTTPAAKTPPGGRLDQPGTAQSGSTTNAYRAIVTPSSDAVGKVISVNQKARYAVLSYSIGALPAIDSRVYAYRNGLKVGELRVSGPQRENN